MTQVKKKKPKTRAFGPLRHKRWLKEREKLHKVAQKIKDEIEISKGKVVSKITPLL